MAVVLPALNLDIDAFQRFDMLEAFADTCGFDRKLGHSRPV